MRAAGQHCTRLAAPLWWLPEDRTRLHKGNLGQPGTHKASHSGLLKALEVPLSGPCGTGKRRAGLTLHVPRHKGQAAIGAKSFEISASAIGVLLSDGGAKVSPAEGLKTMVPAALSLI